VGKRSTVADFELFLGVLKDDHPDTVSECGHFSAEAVAGVSATF
jgi:hypothetical protein